MDRRTFLRTGMAATVSSTLAGCSSLFTVQTGARERMPPLPEDRPESVYYPSHIEGMKMVGTSRKDAAGYACALTYSYPHRFWTVTGNRTKKVSIADDDSLHLMVSVWDTETGTYVMDANPSITVSQGDDSVMTLTPWMMLSQNMGFHAGDNVALPGAGEYSVTVDVPPTAARRTGAFEGRFASQHSFEFTLTYDPQEMDDIRFERLDERAGKRGAVEPMAMETPLSLAPERSALPGRLLGTVRTGDGVFVVTALDGASRFGNGTYLAVSARTPYNRYVLPAMSVSARVLDGDTTVFDGPLRATLDPALNYHYGNTVEGIESGDRVELVVDAPPQVARHEGYETAFLDMPSKTLTVGG